MKKSKIITLILALCLLIGSVIGITVSANTDAPTLDIYTKNLSYGGTISIAYGVAYENIDDPSKIELMVWENTEPADATADYDHLVTKNYEVTVFAGTNNEKTVRALYSPGIPAKNMTNQIYARARINVGTDDAPEYVYSELTRYSVAEYAYDVQFRSDLGAEYVTFGETIISYGEQIQNLLPYETESSPLDYYYVSLKDQTMGTLDGQYPAGIYKAGAKVTLNFNGAVPEGYNFSGQWSSDIGNKVLVANDGEEITVTAHAVYSPVFTKTYYSDEAVDGTRYSFDTADDADAVKESHNAADGEGTYTTTDNLTTSGSAGHAVTITDKAFESTKYNNKGTKYIFEADFTYNGGTPVSSNDLNAAFIGLLSNNGDLTNNGMFAYDYLSYTDTEGSAVTLYGATLDKGKTYNICAIYTVGGGFEFYVDGIKYAATVSNTSNVTDAQYYGFGYYARRVAYQSGLSLTFDNVYMGTVESEYVSYYGNADYASYGNSYGFDDNDSSVLYYFSGTGSSGTTSADVRAQHVAINDGKLTVSEKAADRSSFFFQASDGDTTYAKGTTYVFETKLSWTGSTDEITGSDKNMAFIGFVTDVALAGRVHNEKMPGYDSLNFVDYVEGTGYQNIDFFGAKLARNTEYNIRLEYKALNSTTAGEMAVYVDGVRIANYKLSNTNGVSDNTFGGFSIYTRAENYCIAEFSMTFDDVYVGVIPANAQ